MKLYVGIDYSINSTGICLLSKEHTSFISIYNRYNISKAGETNEDSLFNLRPLLKRVSQCDDVKLVFANRKPKSMPKKSKDVHKELSDWHQNQQACIIKQSRVVITALLLELEAIFQKFIKNKDFDRFITEDVFFCIEHYSYDSKGSALTDLVEYTSDFKRRLFVAFNNVDESVINKNMFIVPGPNVKKMLGNGNADKYYMYKAYLDLNLNTSFAKFCLREQGNIVVMNKKGIKEVESPINDLIDAFFIAKWLKTNLEKSPD